MVGEKSVKIRLICVICVLFTGGQGKGNRRLAMARMINEE
jgi:hypothetical protein